MLIMLMLMMMTLFGSEEENTHALAAPRDG